MYNNIHVVGLWIVTQSLRLGAGITLERAYLSQMAHSFFDLFIGHVFPFRCKKSPVRKLPTYAISM